MPLWSDLGGEARAWPQWVAVAPWNNMFLIIIVVWLQAGFSMVLFSAALKGIPEEQKEAARIDGANEFQIFFRVMIPSHTRDDNHRLDNDHHLYAEDIRHRLGDDRRPIWNSCDCDAVLRQSFTNRNSGYGSAIAIVLLIAVIPVMIYNLKQFREQEAF